MRLKIILNEQIIGGIEKDWFLDCSQPRQNFSYVHDSDPKTGGCILPIVQPYDFYGYHAHITGFLVVQNLWYMAVICIVPNQRLFRRTRLEMYRFSGRLNLPCRRFKKNFLSSPKSRLRLLHLR